MKNNSEPAEPRQPRIETAQTIGLLPLVQQDLQRPRPSAMKPRPTPSIRPACLANPGGSSTKAYHNHRQDADRQIDVKGPAPRPGIGQPPPSVGPGWARRRRRCHRRPCRAPLAGAKLSSMMTGRSLERPAARALEHARENEHGRLVAPRTEGGCRKNDDTKDQQPFPPEMSRKPALAGSTMALETR